MLKAVNLYMQKKNINYALRYHIREYVEYYYENSLEEQSATEEQIFRILSEPLQRELLIESNKIALRDSPIFSKNFSENVINYI